MNRTSKPPEERRAEIVAAARRLFLENGFGAVPVSRIVRSIGVSQGTFYYYFPTKEAALDAVIDDYISGMCEKFDAIASDDSIDPAAALQQMVRTEMTYQGAQELYSLRGVDIHTRLFSRITSALVPRYERVIRRGIDRKVFSTPVPDLIAETILLHVHFLFDRDVLGWSQANYDRRLAAAERLIEVLLDVEPNTFSFS